MEKKQTEPSMAELAEKLSPGGKKKGGQLRGLRVEVAQNGYLLYVDRIDRSKDNPYEMSKPLVAGSKDELLEAVKKTLEG